MKIAVGLASMLAAGIVQAQPVGTDLPTRPIKLISTSMPATAGALLARMLGEKKAPPTLDLYGGLEAASAQ